MKLKSPTVLLVGIAAILGIIVLADVQRGDRPGTDGEGQPLFDFTEEEVEAFTIETPQQTLAFEKDEDGTWQMLEPDQSEASDASISFLLSLLASESSDRTLSLPAADLGDYGFDPPQATVELQLDNQETHEFVLGGPNFNQQNLYAQINPESASESSAEDSADMAEGDSAEDGSTEDDVDTADVVLVTSSFEGAVNRPLEEWKAVEPDAAPEPIPDPAPEATPETSDEPLPDPTPAPEQADE